MRCSRHVWRAFGEARSVEKANISGTPDVATLTEREVGKTEFGAAGRQVYWGKVAWLLPFESQAKRL